MGTSSRGTAGAGGAAMFHNSSPRRARARRRGGTLVEFALLSSFLFTIVFGIIEFGMVINHQLSLMNASRHACRLGAAGKSVTEMRNTIRAVSGLSVTNEMVVVEANSQPDASGAWTTVTDDNTGLSNTATAGYPMRLRVVDWPHQMLVGGMFGWLVGLEQGRLPLSASATLRRE